MGAYTGNTLLDTCCGLIYAAPDSMVLQLCNLSVSMQQQGVAWKHVRAGSPFSLSTKGAGLHDYVDGHTSITLHMGTYV